MLKKCLLGLFVGFVGFISFSNAGIISTENNITAGYGDYVYLNKGQCIRLNQNNCVQYGIIQDGDSYLNISGVNYLYCFNTGGNYFNGYNSSTRCTYWVYDLNNYNGNCSECQECETCSEVDTGAILSGSCDINYCVENGLCPTSSGSRSELMINNIVHEGKPLINVSIPDNIYWDYATNDNQFDLYVGSGYNQEYIDSVLAINSYRPDNQDFTNIFVSGLTLIFPYIFVALLIVFIWKLLKRIFK